MGGEPAGESSGRRQASDEANGLAEVGGDLFGPILRGVSGAADGLEVPAKEGVKEVEDEHRHEPEDQDGIEGVFVDVIGMPVVDQGVEAAFVFDGPSPMAQAKDAFGAQAGLRDGGAPYPFGDLLLLPAVALPADGGALQAPHDAHGPVDVLPTAEALDVPAFAPGLAAPEDRRGQAVEKGARVFHQVAALVLQDGDDLLAAARDEVEEIGAQIQPVRHDDIEGPRVLAQDPLQEPDRAGDLVLAGALHLAVERQTFPAAQERRRHEAVVILYPLSFRRVDRPPQTVRAAPKEARRGFVPVEDQPGPAAEECRQRFVALPAGIDRAQDATHVLAIEGVHHAADRPRTGQVAAEQGRPPALAAGLAQAVQAAQTQEAHDHHRAQHPDRRNPRLPPALPTLRALPDARQQRVQIEHFPCVRPQPAKDDQPLRRRTFASYTPESLSRSSRASP